MSPEAPRPDEGGEFFTLRVPEEAIAAIIDRHGVTREEARTIILQPVVWMERLHNGEDPDEVIAEAEASIADYEARFGPSPDWDESRIALAEGLIAVSNANIGRASKMLTAVKEIRPVFERISQLGARMMSEGLMTLKDGFILSAKLQMAFFEAGRGEEFMRVGFASAGEYGDVLEQVRAMLGDSWEDIAGPLATSADRTDTPAHTEVSYEEAQRHFPLTPWAEIGALVNPNEQWPDDEDIASRLRFVVDVGIGMHGVLEDTKIDRKKAEALKALITTRQAGRAGDAWDQLRFIVALKLYDHADGTKMGRIFARSMDSPDMMAMVVHALLERQRDHDAMEVMRDIPDAKVFGKMLVLGEWPDAPAIAAMIEDLTVVAPNTKQKHDPLLRLGVAQGLHELYAARTEEGDAHAAANAETFRKRAELIERQITSGYIKQSRKK